MLSESFRNLRFLHFILYRCSTSGWNYHGLIWLWLQNDTYCEYIPSRVINKDNLLKNIMQMLMDRFYLACLCDVSQHVCFLCDQLYSALHSNNKSGCLTLPNTNKKTTASANICSQSWCFIHWTSVPLGISLKLRSSNKNYSIKLCEIDGQIFAALYPFFCSKNLTT